MPVRRRILPARSPQTTIATSRTVREFCFEGGSPGETPTKNFSTAASWRKASFAISPLLIKAHPPATRLDPAIPSPKCLPQIFLFVDAYAAWRPNACGLVHRQLPNCRQRHYLTHFSASTHLSSA